MKRKEIGFLNNKKPGDFDIVIIPSSNGKMYFDKTRVFEVKIVRPTNAKFQRNSNSLGSTQTLGIYEDGFPYVGLIQICMNEPVKQEALQALKYLNKDSGTFIYDPFPLYSIELQYDRIRRKSLPNCVGINIFSLSFTSDKQIVVYTTPKFRELKRGKLNPNLKLETIDLIKYHFHRFRENYIRKSV